MSFEATKNLTGARQLVKLIEWELGTIDEYASSGFNSIGGGRGSGYSDRISKALIRKDKIVRTLTSALNACLCIEEASQQELASVENLELRSLIIYRYDANGRMTGKTASATVPAYTAAEGRMEFDLGHQQRIEIVNIPAQSSVTITENSYSGCIPHYVVKRTKADGTVTAEDSRGTGNVINGQTTTKAQAIAQIREVLDREEKVTVDCHRIQGNQ